MKTVDILISDFPIFKSKVQEVQEVLCEALNLNLFNFIEEFKQRIRRKDDMGNEINSYINKGELVPTFVIDKFIKTTLNNCDWNKILISDYPRTEEQYISLENY